MKKLKVLITCGPTWVAIDEVRVISNLSSGQMGHLIAQEFIAQKARVTLLEGPVTHAWSHQSVKVIKYHFFGELKKFLLAELVHQYDVIIHAAAVSDFKVAQPIKGKANSKKPFSLRLISTEKIIDSIKTKAPKSFLVGFKLEPGLHAGKIAQETRALFENSRCDLVVANSLKNGYQGYVVDRNNHILCKVNNKKKLARRLVHLIGDLHEYGSL